MKKDKTLKKEYDKINARVKFTDLSMEDLKKKFKIKYDNSAENYSSFKERQLYSDIKDILNIMSKIQMKMTMILILSVKFVLKNFDLIS